MHREADWRDRLDMFRQIHMHPSHPGGHRYEPRPIRFLGVSVLPMGWSVKSHAITVAGHDPDLPKVGVEAARRTLTEILPVASMEHEGHGVAIQTMHLGSKGFWVLIDWRAYGDVLMPRHLRASMDNPGTPAGRVGGGFGPCVWELAVQAHERRAWMEHVLAHAGGPDMQAYLADGLTAVI